MALAVPTAGNASERVAAILIQLLDEAAQARTIDHIRARVTEFERQYNVASQDLHAAIDAGKLEESHDVCEWLIDYELLLRAGEA
jgi:hypothetical protein